MRSLADLIGRTLTKKGANWHPLFLLLSLAAIVLTHFSEFFQLFAVMLMVFGEQHIN